MPNVISDKPNVVAAAPNVTSAAPNVTSAAPNVISAAPNVRTVYFSRIASPIGPLLIAATERGLCCLQFHGKMPRQAKHEVWIESEEHLRPYQKEIEAYFRGELRAFTCKLDLQGTAFQKKCWEALCRIPYGQTCSYGDIAEAVGRPLAFRAVGQANHNNPVAIIVPCHRVVGANGTLTGYGGGLDVKEKLLRLEGVPLQGSLGFNDSRGNRVARALA